MDEPPRRRPEHGDEVALGEGGEIADRAEPTRVQAPGRRRADPPDALDRETPQERELLVRRQDDEPVRLRGAARRLRQQLRAPAADRHGEPDALARVASEPRCDLSRRPGDPLEPGDVEERLLERDPLDARGMVVEDAEERLARLDVRLEAGSDDNEMRTEPPGLRPAHRTADPVAARLVARRQHDPAAHDDRPAAEARIVPLLDGREERVGVGVEDRPLLRHEHMFASSGTATTRTVRPSRLALLAAALLALAGGAATAAPPAAETRAVGLPWHGRLVAGVTLPADGDAFFTWDSIRRVAPNRDWRRTGTRRLVGTLLDVTAAYRAAHPEAARIGIGDLSRPQGGEFGERFGAPGHASHQNGLDADVYYPRRDGRERPPDRPGQIDRRLAQELVDRFVAAGAVKVFVGPRTGLTGPPAIVEVLPQYHDNHLHVRLPGDGVASAELGTSTLGRSIRAFRVGRGTRACSWSAASTATSARAA